MPLSGILFICATRWYGEQGGMRILKTRSFDKWAREVELNDDLLVEAVKEMSEGLYEANLGGNIFKKRVPLGARGKSGGARTIIAFKANDKAFFVYGFAKSKKGNISLKETEALKALAKIYFGYDDKQIKEALKLGALIEVGI
jgi:hypothetical protein